MSPVRRVAPILLVPALLAAAAGCGGGGGGPTKAEYAAVADGICADAGKKVDDVYMDLAVDQLLAPMTGEESVYFERDDRFVRAKVVPVYEGMSNNLKGIQPPDGDGAYLTDLYADLDKVIQSLHRVPSSGRAVIEQDQQVRDRFESYGMETCPPVYDDTHDYDDPAKVQEEAERRLQEQANPETVSEDDGSGE